MLRYRVSAEHYSADRYDLGLAVHEEHQEHGGDGRWTGALAHHNAIFVLFVLFVDHSGADALLAF
jgi:hypothetical protein